jgi:hypothetical protein
MDRDALMDQFAPLIDLHTGPVGRVVTSERNPAAAHAFSFWTADTPEAVALDIGHIVVAFSEEAAVIGILDEPQRFSDLQTFLDDYFDFQGEEDIATALASTRPEILVFTCRVLATKHLRDDVRSRRPPKSGPVYYATTEAIRYALGGDGFSGTPIPVLLHRNGNPMRDEDGLPYLETDETGAARTVFQHTPVDVDADYLLGPEAGHANWTGQSGLATKTSHALFVISSVFQKANERVAALMFNVKGPDLLWLDKPAYAPDDGLSPADGLLPANTLHRELYRLMNLRPDPFTNLRVFAPFKDAPSNDAGDQINLDGRFIASDLDTLRVQRGESHVCYPILWTLSEVLRYPHRVFEGADLDDKFFGFLDELRDANIHSMAAFERKMAEIELYLNTENDDGKKPQTWNDHHRFTITKAKNRIRNLSAKCRGLLCRNLVNYGELPRCDGPFADRELRVIDLANCNTTVQELLVSATISRIWEYAEQGGGRLGVDKVIIFVDELNKYAPSGGRSGLRDTLVDIAARGRHLNVVLFGAQQFRSKVDDEVVGNAATSFYGRIGDEEITNPSYRSLSESTRAELLSLPKGTLLMRHAHIPVPIFGVFPKPPTMPGKEAHERYGQGVTSEPAQVVYRVMQRHAEIARRSPPTLAIVKGFVGEYALSDTRIDTYLSRFEENYPKAMSRQDPWQYFTMMVTKNER